MDRTTKKLLSLLLAMALFLSCAAALGEEVPTEAAEGVYALMTIPYDLFYQAETTGGSYDSVSSATQVKPLQIEYAGGSFHYLPDGREITGVIFPVRADSEAHLALFGEEVTADTSVTITVNDGGQVITYTLTGADALFQSFPFSWCLLAEAPAVWKALGQDSSFGPMQGLVIPLEGTVRRVSDPYADICLLVEGINEALAGLNVNAVVLEAEDGTRVGLRHVENIWLKTALGFRLDDDVCALLQGKRLVGVELYTFDAKFVVAADLVIE